MPQQQEYKHRISRDGTSQSQRGLAALDPASVKVDARTVKDFLVFAQRFAERIVYRNLDNTDAGNWEVFFSGDPSSIKAAITKSNPEPIRRAAQSALERGCIDLPKYYAHFGRLVEMLGDWRKGLRMESRPFRDQIDRFTRSNLGVSFARVRTFHLQHAEDLGVRNPAFYDGIVFSDELSSRIPGGKPEIEDFEAALVSLNQVIQKIIELAADSFDSDLKNRSDFEPHLGLFISFLRLYQLLRDDANSLTTKHLNFFYENALRIKHRSATPDRIHVVFELAKQVQQEHRISKKTKIDAAADATDLPRHYGLDDELVANKAQIVDYRTVFVQRLEDDQRPLTVFAAPVADSGDGRGGDFEDPTKPSWPTLGTSSDENVAKIGFAIASRSLLLSQGERCIVLQIQGEGIPDDDGIEFVVEFSSEDGWHKVGPVKAKTDPDKQTLTITVDLKSTDPVVTFADDEKLETSFGTTDPILRLTLDQSKTEYDLVKNIKVKNVILNTSVGFDKNDKLTSGLTNLVVQNDQFVMDAAKPFQPFGVQPSVLSNFYVGSAEVFQKNLESLALRITWDAVPKNFELHYSGYKAAVPELPNLTTNSYKAKLSILQDGKWLRESQEPSTEEDKEPETVLYVEKIDDSDTDAAQHTDTTQDADNERGENAEQDTDTQPDEASLQTTGAKGTVDTERELRNAELKELVEIQQPRKIDELTEWTPSTQNGFIRFQLNEPTGAFFHAYYAKVLTYHALKPHRDAEDGRDPNPFVPNEPYTPTIKGFELSYKASVDSLNSKDSISLFHLNPFGHRERVLPSQKPTPEDLVAKALCRHLWLVAEVSGQKIPPSQHVTLEVSADYAISLTTPKNHYRSRITAEDGTLHFDALVGRNSEVKEQGFADKVIQATRSVEVFEIEENGGLCLKSSSGEESIRLSPVQHLLPQFNEEGSLYMGVKDLQPRQTLSVLFQVAEGTADAEISKPSQHVRWSYLKGDDWADLEQFAIASDTTQGLTASGIIKFSVPDDILSDSTWLPKELNWIRASVDSHVGAVSDLIKAHTQAASATFVDSDNDPSHLETPLPPESVVGLVEDDTAIAAVTQPYGGFGARPKERGAAFYTRVAEHLRHKGRPITLFDYERLVLDHFPRIYKVKCINHTRYDERKDRHLEAPGHILIAVIADFRKLTAVNRREPKVTVDDLTRIADFLASRNCPFVPANSKNRRLQLKNPVFETVRVRFGVAFHRDVTARDFHRRKLESAINQFLSPWAFDDVAEISFGGVVYKSSILNFVEKQPYVDYVKDFELVHQFTLRGEDQENVVNAIETKTPRSILVPDTQHEITFIEPARTNSD